MRSVSRNVLIFVAVGLPLMMILFTANVQASLVWVPETVDSPGDVGWYTSIALDSSDNPHISYFDETNSDLKYARWNGTDWITETVDSDGQVGTHTSITLDSSDNPHISYFDGTNMDLKYAWWNGTDWVPETVDSDGDGTPDVTDTDDDNDGTLDVDDAFPLDPTESVDTDGDGVGNNADTDDDDDGMPDTWETDNELDPLNAADASLDPDGDGLTNLQEYQGGTDPNVSDAQAFPLWVLGAAVAIVIGGAVAATFLWRRRKQP